MAACHRTWDRKSRPVARICVDREPVFHPHLHALFADGLFKRHCAHSVSTGLTTAQGQGPFGKRNRPPSFPGRVVGVAASRKGRKGCPGKA